ncbi:hypothetical protein OD350_03690 [Clostridium beijerinckii]|uniref:hypothetical protein n=1 Tax=Clostridium beijerinckii TaxID=1520 RepID=UPI002227037B|nr:hypothetical protein [Clostridium beijerinckii]UYZ36785.1 hypothetical protein OD350_03690 [Clostridium beijerinckii]
MKELEHLDCMGEERRKEIVNDYYIKLIIYAKLLNGQTKKSDAHRIIKDTYYQFQCTLKSDENIIKAITCGSGAGEHLIELANIDKPRIFNPLINELPGGNGGGGNGGNITKKKWDPLAKELYNAIRWLVCCWDVVPYGKLLNIKEDLEKFRNEPHMWKIEFVNNAISKDSRGRTISEMIEEVRNNGNNIRDFSFELINKRLEENNIKSYF